MTTREVWNACTLVGLRNLLGDDDYADERLIDHIDQNKGCADPEFLAEVAPVKVWNNDFELSGGPDWAQITQGDESLLLSDGDKIGVVFNNGPEQHMETVAVTDLPSFLEGKEVTTLVTLSDE